MKNYIYITAILTVALTFCACDDMLDRVPETSRTEAAAFDTPKDFEMAVNYFYDSLVSNGNDLNSDFACEAGSSISPLSDSSYGIPTTDSDYTNYYVRMRRINQIFANTYKISDQSTINRYLAEAYFFRAYFAYIAFKKFGPLTSVKEVYDISSPELYAARDTRDDFADFIIGDLEQAISMNVLPKESALTGGTEEGRITIGAAESLLAEFCLFEGTWQKYHYNNTARANALFDKAITASEAVMEDGSYELFHNDDLGAESYRYMFTLESVSQTNPANVLKSANHEYILRKRFNENENGNYLYTSGADTKCKIVASRKIAEMYLAADGTIATMDYKTSYTSFMDNKDPRFGMNFRAPNSYIWCYSNGRVNWTGDEADKANRKLWAATDLGYTNNKWVTERSVNASKWGIDIPIIRLGEVYLIYAEAVMERNGAITDTQLNKSINKLRDRVGMVHLTNGTVPAGSDMLTEIRRERAVELFLEGFRYDDVRRWAIAEKEMSEDFEYLYVGAGSAFLLPRTDNGSNQSMPVAESISADGYAIKQPASKRKFESKHYLCPLPLSQLELNKNLKQNAGWEEE